MTNGGSIAVVGAGVAGLTAALRLQDRFDVTLIDADTRIGGHANPRSVATPDGPVTVDTGFIVFNLGTYPKFVVLLAELGLSSAVAATDMSFSFSSPSPGLSFSDQGWSALTDGGRNLLRPSALRLFVDFLRLRRRAARQLRAGTMPDVTLEEYTRTFAPQLRHAVLYPLAAAVWTLPEQHLREYPAIAFFRFFANHNLLEGSSDRAWRTLLGSSAVYLEAIRARLRGPLRLGRGVKTIIRDTRGVDVVLIDGERLRFDAVVLATQADISLRLLEVPTEPERRLLGPWRYHATRAVLHRDERLMPPDRRHWACWNVIAGEGPPLVTYHLNRVQHLATRTPVLLSLTDREVDAGMMEAEFRYRHPIFDAASVATQSQLTTLDGVCRTWFCGSYFGDGFHEDAVASAQSVARRLSAAGREGET